ncbi:MAG: hypothetical protein RIS92_2313 [Verrucomicrobiota bacterium]|jgi:F-type H+-transporting ATPase subunit b
MTTVPFLLANSGGSPLDTAKQVGEIFGFNQWMFVSQVISFSLVCFVLAKFAYKPVLKILAERRDTIERSLKEAAAIREQLAEAEKRASEITAKASADAQRIVQETREAMKSFEERQTQAAIAQAEEIVKKAHEATKAEREREFAKLKAEVADLVVATTAKVIGRTLSTEDQSRLAAEASSELAA